MFVQRLKTSCFYLFFQEIVLISEIISTSCFSLETTFQNPYNFYMSKKRTGFAEPVLGILKSLI